MRSAAQELSLGSAVCVFQFVSPKTVFGSLTRVCREWSAIIRHASLNLDFAAAYLRNTLKVHPFGAGSLWHDLLDASLADSQCCAAVRRELLLSEVRLRAPARTKNRWKKTRLISELRTSARADAQVIAAAKAGDSTLSEAAVARALSQRSRVFRLQIGAVLSDARVCQNCLAREEQARFLKRTSLEYGRPRLCRPCQGLLEFREVGEEECAKSWGVSPADLEQCGFVMKAGSARQADWTRAIASIPRLQWVSAYVVAHAALWKYHGRDSWTVRLSREKVRALKLRRGLAARKAIDRQSKGLAPTARLLKYAPDVDFEAPPTELLESDHLFTGWLWADSLDEMLVECD